MKKLLLIVAVLFVVACKKNDTPANNQPPQSIAPPTSISGTYSSTRDCGSSSNYVDEMYVFNEKNGTAQFSFQHYGSLRDTLTMNITGSTLVVPSQTFKNTGWAGGTYTVFGSGTFNDPIINLTFTQTYSVDGKSYNCVVSAHKK